MSGDRQVLAAAAVLGTGLAFTAWAIFGSGESSAEHDKGAQSTPSASASREAGAAAIAGFTGDLQQGKIRMTSPKGSMEDIAVVPCGTQEAVVAHITTGDIDTVRVAGLGEVGLTPLTAADVLRGEVRPVFENQAPNEGVTATDLTPRYGADGVAIFRFAGAGRVAVIQAQLDHGTTLTLTTACGPATN